MSSALMGTSSLSSVGHVSSTAPIKRQQRVRALRSPAAVCVASAAGSVVIAGSTTSTGRLVAGLAVKAFGGENVTLIVNKDAQASYWPEDMPTEIAEQRMYAPEAELVKATLVDPRDAGDALATAEVLIFCAEWGASQLELAEALLPRASANLKRAVMLSRVGINRRDKVPFVEQNKPPKKMQELALGLKLPVGGDSGQPGSLDGFAAAEQALASAAAGQSWSAHVVRSGELRGNGPLLMADLSARLVDNLYDVKYQDLYFRTGDEGQGYTKRLNLAATLLRVATAEAAPPADVAALSVVCEMLDPFGLLGEKTLTDPTEKPRRMGYDMAKGKTPAPIEDKLIDELIAAL
uniref:NAD(P)-binding domain-containing protein n=1 Tax=Mantoniella antarctica TaxID=81844 RepID=A0A7S0XBD2_9CHLO|mmetsp:Transcript_32888/g.82913  ORF Transcript_32888/g.82913 Transcript_32888/m.82913 type:complete len:350 (+) Transcript_32888:80-1129(+)